jgi:transposase
MENKNQLSLFDGATLDPGAEPSESHLEIARNREQLIKVYLVSLTGGRRKTQDILKFLENYELGAYQEIREVLGKVSKSTLYGWIRDYREGGFDALISLYKCRGSKISRAEERCLRELILDHISIGQAIFITKYFLKRRGTESPSSPATLRRWAKKITKKQLT